MNDRWSEWSGMELFVFLFIYFVFFFFFFFKQKTAYEIVSRDWSSDVCSSDLNFGQWMSKRQLPAILKTIHTFLCCCKLELQLDISRMVHKILFFRDRFVITTRVFIPGS